jgi:hypothetical protein
MTDRVVLQLSKENSIGLARYPSLVLTGPARTICRRTESDTEHHCH